MNLLNNQQLDFYNRTKSRIRKAKKVCFYPGCSEPTIRGHVFPKSFLANIQENQEVVILTEDDLFKKEGDRYYFKKVRIKRGLPDTGHGMRCFCNKHDHQLFQKLEGCKTINEIKNYENFPLSKKLTPIRDLNIFSKVKPE